jgi:hypothetical protein
MAKVLDFREEARGCLLLAEVETHPEVRTILMGMVLGWLMLAKHTTSSTVFEQSRADEMASV